MPYVRAAINESVVCPTANNLIVGLKPTAGLVSQNGIIPISRGQDTAGPMARTVTDVAILLGPMQSPFGLVPCHPVPGEYTQLLQRGSLAGKRIGVDTRYFTEDYGNVTRQLWTARTQPRPRARCRKQQR